jgi:AmmeMemoRadiSam system protein B/AmmeMemoRadiSam system protein A
MELKDRVPAVAGTFYEDDSTALRGHLKQLFAEAGQPVSEDEVAAIIVPHAGYVFSGGVAASGFNQILSDAVFERVFLLGSSHQKAFKGASVYRLGDYITPLGKVEVDVNVAEALINSSPLISSDPSVHIEEHALEVELPFLQYHLKHPFKLVPLVMSPHDPESAAEVAEVLKKWFCPGNLFVISTDFSHYPSYDDAVKIDEITNQAIMDNDPDRLLQTLENNRHKNVAGLATSLCGWTSVLALLHLTRSSEDLHFRHVAYKNSGDSPFGDKQRVVGYNAISVFRKHKTKRGGDGFYLDTHEKAWLLNRARMALEAAARNESLQAPVEEMPDHLLVQAGAFVSLYKARKLRGCIGSFEESIPIWKTVDRMTASAALNDTRFSPVHPDEISDIKIEISVLTPMRRIDDVSEIIPGKHGIVVEKDGQSGTFLPQVASKTGWNREELLGYCARDKAGLEWDDWEKATIYVYEAFIFGE